jgi:hypothetical protein
VIAYRYIFYNNLLNKISMGISFLKKKRFSPFERRFPYLLLWNFSATALAGRFCVARGTRDTKIQVIECQFPLCISLLCANTLFSYAVCIGYRKSVASISNHVKMGSVMCLFWLPLLENWEAASFTVRSTPNFRNTNWIEPKTVTWLFWLPLLKSRGSQNSHVTVRIVMWPLLVRFN